MTDFWLGRRVLVTGGAGFLGSRVVRYLLERGVPPARIGAAEGLLLLAAELYDGAEPVNLGSAIEILIREMAELIARETGFRDRIVWDTSKPNSQPRRKLDTGRAEREFGFHARADFSEGLRRTVTWYRAQRAATSLLAREEGIFVR